VPVAQAAMDSSLPHMAAVCSASTQANQDEHVSACGPSASVLQEPSLVDPTLPQPFPLPSPSPQDLPSPLQERRPDLGFSFAGNVLPSPAPSLPTPPIVKNAHNLRLPSFDLLGIASPHPDRIPLQSISSFSPLGAGPLSKPEDPLHVLSPPLGRLHKLDGAVEPFTTTPQSARAHVEHLVPVITPPAEPGTLHWGSFVNVRPAGLGSPPSSDPGVSPNLTTTANASATAPNAHTIVPTVSEFDSALGMEVWVQRIKDILGRCFDLRGPHAANARSYRISMPESRLRQALVSCSALPLHEGPHIRSHHLSPS
jgi:hypothetical protein